MRCIELFSGAGGMAHGLHEAGFCHEALVEKNRHAVSTLRANQTENTGWIEGAEILEADIRTIGFKERFGTGLDLVAGGPPCQPFSLGGKHRAWDDQRDLFSEAVRAVGELEPKAFLFENVRGLMREKFTDYVEFIRLRLEYPQFPISVNLGWEQNLRRLQRHRSSSRCKELSYRVSIHQANAADYGVPQHRHRVFFVGIRNDLNPGWSFPIPTHSRGNLLSALQSEGTYWDDHGLQPPKARRTASADPDFLTERWRTVRDAIKGLPNPKDKSASQVFRNHHFQRGARIYPGHTGSPLDEPAKALKAGDHGVPGGENMLRHPNGKVRYFTAREAARIQTLPDDFRLEGSWSEVMRQLENAVPSKLAACIGKSLADRLTQACPTTPSIK